MKDDAARIAAYLAKTVPATVSLKIAAALGTMKTSFGTSITPLVLIEQQIQGICNAAGLPTIQYPFYLNFGREIFSKLRAGIDGPSLADVAQSLHNKYESYGLASATLVDIADQVFTLTVI